MCDSGCVCPYICVYVRLCICCCCLSPHTTTVLESASATHSLMYVCVCVYVWCLDVAATVDDRTSWSFSAGSFLQLPAHTHTHKFIHTHTSINTHKYTHTHLLLVTSPYWPVSSPLVSLFSLMSSTFGQEVTSLSEFLCPDFTLLSVT